MKKHKLTKLQVYSFIASMPIIDFVLNYIMFEERLFSEINIWLISFPIIFLIGIASWYTHTLIASAVNKKYPELKQTRIRILLLSICIIPFMSANVVLIF